MFSGPVFTDSSFVVTLMSNVNSLYLQLPTGSFDIEES